MVRRRCSGNVHIAAVWHESKSAVELEMVNLHGRYAPDIVRPPEKVVLPRIAGEVSVRCRALLESIEKTLARLPTLMAGSLLDAGHHGASRWPTSRQTGLLGPPHLPLLAVTVRDPQALGLSVLERRTAPAGDTED